MPALLDLQRQFVRACQTGQMDSLLPFVVSNQVSAQNRLAVYENNYQLNLLSALRITYPVVDKLVGEDFFAFAARRYIAQTPSRSGNLDDYGAEFGSFLETFEPAQGLPYLADVARLEWLLQLAFNAADPVYEPGQVIEALQQSPDDVALVLGTSVGLLHSPYPVKRIWEINQPDADAEATVDLGEGVAWLLVRRDGYEQGIEEVDPVEYTLLLELRQGAGFDDAVEAALKIDPNFDLGVTIARYLANGTLTSLHIPTRAE